jgi:hypothetical protein
MKNAITTLALATLCAIAACTKESATVSNTPAPLLASPSGGSQYGIYGHSFARLSGPDYSQSIPVDTANRMIKSYLDGVGYPMADTAIRALSFDADTLRAYLANHDITTVKFMFAHQQNYINGGGYGTHPGLNPNAITLVIAGLNDNDQYVLNSRNGVYDHM